MSEIFTPQNGETPSDGRPALVLDTNTVLALWMFRDPMLDKLRDWIDAGHCRLYSREDALEELRRVLTYRQFGLDTIHQARLHASYRRHLTPWTNPHRVEAEQRVVTLPRCRDNNDQKFLEITCLCGAGTLVTRDKALLRLARHRLLREHFFITRPEQVMTAPAAAK